MKRRASIALPILAVLAVFVFFGSAGTWSFPRVQWYSHFDDFGEGYYPGQAEGYLRGQLSIAATPDPRLVALRDPYNSHERHGANVEYLWDASYYRGRYYLYFSPLPVLLFYLPFRLVGGGYPPDPLAAVFFCAWAYIAAVAFVLRALAGRKLLVPMSLWLLVLGVGTIVPFVLGRVRVYEVAIVAGMAMSASWALATLRFMETRTRASAVWMGVWLALAIAARPNLGVLLFVTAFVLFRAKDRRAAVLTIIPLVSVAIGLMAYNYARFGELFEFGVTYQLTFVPMRDHPVCRLCTWPELLRVINSAGHYVFWMPSVGSEFPFADLQTSRLDPHVSFPGQAEQSVGIAALVPLTLAGSFTALLLMLRREERETGTTAAMYLTAAAWLILFGLSACWWVTARYALDFMLLMIAGTIVCVEAGLTRLAAAGFAVMPLRIAAMVLACYSILLGFFLGFMGTTGIFQRANPELFHTLQRWLM